MDVAAVALDDAFSESEADAGALVLLAGEKSLDHLEHGLAVRRTDAAGPSAEFIVRPHW